MFHQQENPTVKLFFQAGYFVNSTGYYEILNVQGTLVLGMSMNYTSGTGIAVLSAETHFNISKFYINNSTLFDSAAFPLIKSYYTGIAVQRLTQQYFLLSTCNLSNTIYSVWDAYNQVSVVDIKLNLGFIILVRSGFDYRVYQIPVAGVVGQNFQSVIDAIVWGYQDMTYLYNINGKVVSYQTPNEVMGDIYSLATIAFGYFRMTN